MPNDSTTEARALALAEQLKAYCEWSGWYGTAPAPISYPEQGSSRPLDERNTVVKMLIAALAAARLAGKQELAELIAQHVVDDEDEFTSFKDMGGPIPAVEFDVEAFAKWCRQHAQEVGP